MRMAHLIWIAALCTGALAQDAPWPMLHRDAARSGYSPETLKGPYERKWYVDLHDEVIATRVEAIVADRKVFVPTLAGRLHAFNVDDGTAAWAVQMGGPIGASPLYLHGKLYCGCDRGQLICLDATSGKVAWAYDAQASIWVSPATDGRRIFFGDRSGTFHALDAATGKQIWTFQAGYIILGSASVTEEGLVLFASEDMHLYALSAGDGKLVWKSSKMGGLSARDHAPTLWRGLAIVTTNPATSFHRAPGENPSVLTRAQKSLALEEGDRVVHDKWGGYALKPTPRRIAAEQEAIVNLLKEQRAYQTFYAFDVRTGLEPWVAGVLYTAGLHNPMTPPTFDPESGILYLWTASALANYHVGVSGGAITVATLDRQTGRTTPIYHNNGDRMGWAFDFAAPADETQSLSLMGNVLLNTHQGIIGGMRLDSLKWTKVYIARDTYGGIFGPAAVSGSFQGARAAHAQGRLTLMANQWHGPDQGIVAIGYGRMFWISGSQLVCIAGPDIVRQPGGGTQPPPPIARKALPLTPGGNVANSMVGEFDETVPLPKITVEQLVKLLKPGDRKSVNDAALQERLTKAVEECIAHEWSPLIVELGISGEERLFWRTSETMGTLASALPRLPEPLRRRVVSKLNEMWDSGMPLARSVHPFTAQRREFHDLGPEMMAFAKTEARYTANVEDLYAVWCYAQYAGEWERVLRKMDDLRRIVEAHLEQPVKFAHGDKDADAAEHLNGQIGGLIGAHRLLVRAKQDDLASRVMDRLTELVALRVQHEMADTRLVRETRTASHKLHQAKVPRYCAMTPELGAILGDLAGAAARRNLKGVSRDLPVWHHAWGERMIGGENYISPPSLSDGIFLSSAYTGAMDHAELISRLDVPWCRADLMYIRKLVAVLHR